VASYSVNERAVAREWRHKDIELAAHDLLQLLDETSG
jgi:hypothetical protein